MTLATSVDIRLTPSDPPMFPFWAWSALLHIGIVALLSLLHFTKNIEPIRSVVKVTLVEATTSQPTPTPAGPTHRKSTPPVPPQQKTKTPIEPVPQTPILMKAQRPITAMTQPTISIPRPLPTLPTRTTITQIPVPSQPVETVQTKPRRVLQDTRATNNLNLKNFLKVAQRSTASRTPTAQTTAQLGIVSSVATLPPSLSRSSTGSDSPTRQSTPRKLTPNVLKAMIPGSGSISKSKVGLDRTIPPVYPRIARESGWEGTVLVRVTVQPDGSPESVKIQKSSGHSILDTAALEAVKKWKFSPAKDGNIPIRSVLEIPINFYLRNQQG